MKVKKIFSGILAVVMLSSAVGCSGEKVTYQSAENLVEQSEARVTQDVVQCETEVSVEEELNQEQQEDPRYETVEYGDEVYINCYRNPITGQWVEQGEVTFVADVEAKQFQPENKTWNESSILTKVEEAVGKKVGDSFTVNFYYGESEVYNRYTVLEIEKNSELGNQKDSIEYGDTIRASYKSAECSTEGIVEEEYLGGVVLKVDEATTKLSWGEVVCPESVVKEMIQKVQGERRWSGPMVSYGEQHEYWFRIVMVNEVVEPSWQFPENWNYQFAAPQIGSFQAYSLEHAGTDDMENGELYGFDDWLTDGCSAWCGGEDYICEAVASSTLANQGNVNYSASNLTSENRNSVWAEGVEGVGIGESIFIKQMYAGTGDTEFTMSNICIVNGYAQNKTKWQENGRVKSLKMYYEDEYMGLITLEDTINPQFIDVTPVQMKVGNGFEANFRFEIAEVYEGTKYEDTCLTGIVIDFDGKYAH